MAEPMKMHLLSGGRLTMPKRTYYPRAERGELFELPVSCGLFKHAQGNVLFDTGCHPDAAAGPEGRWGPIASFTKPIFKPEDTVVHQLPKAGLTAGDIDVVVCSHLHIDHCGCNVFFPRATVICHARELEQAKADLDGSLGYMRIDWDHGQRFECIEAQHDLFGDGRITLLPAPGHTPGSIIAHVVLDKDGPFVLAADTIAVQACLDERYTPKVTWDVDKSHLVYDEVERLQKDGATVLFGHDDAQWRQVRKGEAFYA